MIRVQGLRKRYGENAVLAGVDVEAPEGSIVTLVGPSGCGKSTLLRCFNALTSFEEGTLEIAGFRLEGGVTPSSAELVKLRSAVGMVFQELHLFPHLSVLDNVTLAPRVVRKTPRAEAERHARELLGLVGLGQRAAARPAELSGGQKQRVAIARAIAQGARVLLLDEPTSALDAALREDMRELLVRAAHGDISPGPDARPLTLVVVTHDRSLAVALGGVTWTLEAGRVVSRG
ncbi:MAG TPA: ATP-binding cassette domain-containing protein [Polyangiaceae bacterium]|nr:ATP-binding cassette domain-containing protein [Polyangiaceae bacterium]